MCLYFKIHVVPACTCRPETYYSFIVCYCTLTSTQRTWVCSRGRDAGWSREWGGLTKLAQTNTRLAVRARPLRGRLPPLGPCRTAARHRHCLQHQVRLSAGQRQAQPLPPVLPPHHRAPVVEVGGRLLARHPLHSRSNLLLLIHTRFVR